MNHVVSFSTGLSSALTVERVLNRYTNAEIVFMDTTIEDDDNYRFMRQMQTRWGVEITVLREGRTPYQVFSDQHVIPNHRVAPCTQELKIKMFVSHLKETYAGQDVTIHIGYDFTEIHRCEAVRNNYNAQGWQVDFPLLWKPYEFRPYAQVCRGDWGIEPPRMYAMGYSHANCGGRCVKQGQADWIKTLINFPERYAEAEAWEKGMRETPTNKNYALLQDRAGGVKRAKTLQELREGDYRSSSLLDDAGCIHCGVGDFDVALAAVRGAENKMSDPTPTTREREAALSIFGNEIRTELYTRIAAALARERREAEREQMERDCKAVCRHCLAGNALEYRKEVKRGNLIATMGFFHSMFGFWEQCDAEPIRAAAIERVRDGEKG